VAPRAGQSHAVQGPGRPLCCWSFLASPAGLQLRLRLYREGHGNPGRLRVRSTMTAPWGQNQARWRWQGGIRTYCTKYYTVVVAEQERAGVNRERGGQGVTMARAAVGGPFVPSFRREHRQRPAKCVVDCRLAPFSHQTVPGACALRRWSPPPGRPAPFLMRPPKGGSKYLLHPLDCPVEFPVGPHRRRRCRPTPFPPLPAPGEASVPEQARPCSFRIFALQRGHLRCRRLLVPNWRAGQTRFPALICQWPRRNQINTVSPVTRHRRSNGPSRAGGKGHSAGPRPAQRDRPAAGKQWEGSRVRPKARAGDTGQRDGAGRQTPRTRRREHKLMSAVALV